MEKRINYSVFMSVKSVAKACNPLITKRDSIKKQIEELAKEYNDYDTQVKSLEAGIKATLGFRVEELVKKVVEPTFNEDGTPKISKDGKPVKATKYVPTDIVSYDKDHKQFVITVPDEEKPSAPIDEAPENNTETVGEGNVAA